MWNLLLVPEYGFELVMIVVHDQGQPKQVPKLDC